MRITAVLILFAMLQIGCAQAPVMGRAITALDSNFPPDARLMFKCDRYTTSLTNIRQAMRKKRMDGWLPAMAGYETGTSAVTAITVCYEKLAPNQPEDVEAAVDAEGDKNAEDG
jgi:hypothetical protein